MIEIRELTERAEAACERSRELRSDQRQILKELREQVRLVQSVRTDLQRIVLQSREQQYYI